MVFGEIVIFWLPPCVKFSIFKRYHLFTFNILSEESVFTETPNEALYTIKMILIQIRWTGGELVLDAHWPPTASTRPLTPPRRRPPTPCTPPPTPRTSPPTPPRGTSTPTTGKFQLQREHQDKQQWRQQNPTGAHSSFQQRHFCRPGEQLSSSKSHF